MKKKITSTWEFSSVYPREGFVAWPGDRNGRTLAENRPMEARKSRTVYISWPHYSL